MQQNPSARRPPAFVGLGTVHCDPSGFKRLTHRLDAIQPDVVLLEFSPYGRLFRMRRQRQYLRHLLDNLRDAAMRLGLPLQDALKRPDIDAIRRQIAYPFEYRAARRYSSRRGAPVLLVDHSLFSMRWILRWPELIDTRNLELLLGAPSRRLSASNQYRFAQGWLGAEAMIHSESVFCPAASADEAWRVRERLMAERIEKVLRVGGALRPVFIGGWWHLAPCRSFPTLRSLLSLSPAQCALLQAPPGTGRLSHRQEPFHGDPIASAGNMC